MELSNLAVGGSCAAILGPDQVTRVRAQIVTAKDVAAVVADETSSSATSHWVVSEVGSKVAVPPHCSWDAPLHVPLPDNAGSGDGGSSRSTDQLVLVMQVIASTLGASDGSVRVVGVWTSSVATVAQRGGAGFARQARLMQPHLARSATWLDAHSAAPTGHGAANHTSAAAAAVASSSAAAAGGGVRGAVGEIRVHMRMSGAEAPADGSGTDGSRAPGVLTVRGARFQPSSETNTGDASDGDYKLLLVCGTACNKALTWLPVADSATVRCRVRDLETNVLRLALVQRDAVVGEAALCTLGTLATNVATPQRLQVWHEGTLAGTLELECITRPSASQAALVGDTRRALPGVRGAKEDAAAATVRHPCTALIFATVDHSPTQAVTGDWFVFV